MVINSELLRNNCKEFAESHPKAVDTLRELNGKQTYIQIAIKLKITSTKVSGLQKKALELGLAKKLDNGRYKKIPGILGYMPKLRIKEKKKITVQSIISAAKKKKHHKAIQNKLFVSTRVQVALEKMTKAYHYLYSTENVLRELVRKVFQLQPNPNWWKNKVPRGVQISVADTIQKTPYHAAKRHDELEYTHLGQLKEIIVSNWKDFLPFLNEQSKQAFQVTIDKAIPSRNSIGHCIPLHTADLKVVDVRFQDILEMIR